jgi:hypothetical protein
MRHGVFTPIICEGALEDDAYALASLLAYCFYLGFQDPF